MADVDAGVGVGGRGRGENAVRFDAADNVVVNVAVGDAHIREAALGVAAADGDPILAKASHLHAVKVHAGQLHVVRQAIVELNAVVAVGSLTGAGDDQV